MNLFKRFFNTSSSENEDSMLPAHYSSDVDLSLPVKLSSDDALQVASMHRLGGMTSKIADAYIESKRINSNIKALRIQTNAVVSMHAKQIMAARECVTHVFSERSAALNKHYEVLDKGLKTEDRELIIASLQGISSIVVSNPLQQIATYVNALNNSKEPLFLDF